MSNNSSPSVVDNFFQTPKAQCANETPGLTVDDPGFANLDSQAGSPDLGGSDEAAFLPFGRKSSRKPMPYDMFLSPVKMITKRPDHVKGFKFEVTAPSSHKFLMSHTWQISPPSQNFQGMGQRGQMAIYMLNIQYIGGEIDPYLPPTGPPAFILQGRMDSMGKLEATMMKNFDERTNIRISAGFPNGDVNHAGMECALEHEGDDYVGTLKYGTNMWGYNYMQTIGRRLVLGFDLLNASDRKQSLLSGAVKYTYLKHAFYGQYSAPMNQLTLAYFQKVNRNVQLVSELNVNLLEGETKTVLGYRQKFNTTEVVATVNSKGKVNSVISLLSNYFQLKLCATADYQKDSYKFGYGISFGQPQ